MLRASTVALSACLGTAAWAQPAPTETQRAQCIEAARAKLPQDPGLEILASQTGEFPGEKLKDSTTLVASFDVRLAGKETRYPFLCAWATRQGRQLFVVEEMRPCPKEPVRFLRC